MPPMEAGDENDRLGRHHRKGRNATEGQEAHSKHPGLEAGKRRLYAQEKEKGTKACSYEKGDAVLVLQEVWRKLEETLPGARQGERPGRQAGAAECGLGFTGPRYRSVVPRANTCKGSPRTLLLWDAAVYFSKHGSHGQGSLKTLDRAPLNLSFDLRKCQSPIMS